MLRKSALLVLLVSVVFGMPNRSTAYADDIVVMPSANLLTSGVAVQGLQSIQYKPQSIDYIDVGSEYAQLEVSYVARPTVDRFAVSAESPLLPETFTTPSVSFGIRDIANSAGAFRSAGYYGRGYYLVASKNLDNDLNPPKLHDVSLSFGIGLGSIHGPFGGISTGLPLKLIGTAEYDSRSMNYRVALPLNKIAAISYDRVSGGNFVGLDLHSPVGI